MYISLPIATYALLAASWPLATAEGSHDRTNRRALKSKKAKYPTQEPTKNDEPDFFSFTISFDTTQFFKATGGPGSTRYVLSGEEDSPDASDIDKFTFEAICDEITLEQTPLESEEPVAITGEGFVCTASLCLTRSIEGGCGVYQSAGKDPLSPAILSSGTGALHFGFDIQIALRFGKSQNEAVKDLFEVDVVVFGTYTEQERLFQRNLKRATEVPLFCPTEAKVGRLSGRECTSLSVDDYCGNGDDVVRREFCPTQRRSMEEAEERSKPVESSSRRSLKQSQEKRYSSISYQEALKIKFPS